jgi:hypothetical protein
MFESFNSSPVGKYFDLEGMILVMKGYPLFLTN